MADNWQIIEEQFDERLLNQRETVFTIGNGYLGTRGSFEEGFPGEQAVTLVNGVYDDIPIVTSELTNCPDWTRMHLIAGGKRFSMLTARFSGYSRSLDLHDGVVTRRLRWQIKPEAALELVIERFASLADEHLAAVRWRVRSDGFSGRVEFRAGLSSQVDTAGFLHWNWQEQGVLDRNSAFLRVKTRATGIELAAAFSLVLEAPRVKYQYWDSLGHPELVASTDLRPGDEAAAEKITIIYTSRDVARPFEAAKIKAPAARKAGFDQLRTANRSAWAEEWKRCDITIEGNDRADRAVRYNLFQLLIAAPRHDERVSIPAKSLSGYGYHGHIFWDTETFILPFFIFTSPHIARNLLKYRYLTLPEARKKAARLGYEGALYAWESAATGMETTPRWVPGPEGEELVRIWCGDIEHHISADVAYAVYQYWQVTGDDAFMREYGAEIILSTAKFWASRASWDASKEKYVIRDVIGPDENHEHVDNNAYTNLLARWNIQKAFGVLDWLRQTDAQKTRDLEERLDLSAARLQHWRDVAEKIYPGYNPQTRLFEQFEGFFKLNDPGLASFEPRTRSVQAIMGIQSAQTVQIIKQPDVLMMLYLLESEFDAEIRQANQDYYTPRTDLTYGSSLGPAIQAVIASRNGDLDAGFRHFLHAALTDLEDSRGNSVDGFHAATAGGVWQAVVFGFGLVDPLGKGAGRPADLPDCFTRLRFRVQVRGQWLDFDLTPARAEPEDCREVDSTIARRFPVRGAIFDLDGVLTDTSELHYLAWQRLADEEGIPFSRKENEALRGIPRRDSLLLLLKGRSLPEEKLEELMQRKNRYYLDLVDQLGPGDLLPGARELLEELNQKGIRIAIGSASKNARLVLDHLGIGNLELPPGQCVVFEDAAAGVEAALSGGMWAVGIGPQDRVGKADVVLPSLNRITWGEILSGLEQSQEKSRT